MYKNSFIPSTATILQHTSYMTSSIEYKYNKHYLYKFKYDYDLERSLRKNIEIGFLYQKRCWDFGIRYVENNRPILDEFGQPSSIRDRYLYFTIRLKPIMSSDGGMSGFAFRLPDASEGN